MNTNWSSQQNQDINRTIIYCIIEDDEVAANNDLALEDERARPNGTGDGQFEAELKLKHSEKAKPRLPEVELLQGQTTTQTSWGLNNLNNVVVHHCNDTCACMADSACMYSRYSYQSQDSF